MGQRSQIYIRGTKTNGERVLLARYFQWNYGERMISRARWTVDFIRSHSDDCYWEDKSFLKKLARIVDVNFDMHDIVMSTDILKEYEEWGKSDDFAPYVFFGQDNNDGKLLIDVDIKSKKIKYAFLDCDGSSDKIMNGDAYMKWDITDDWRNEFKESDDYDAVKVCEENIKAIAEMATLMTEDEVDAFFGYDYER